MTDHTVALGSFTIERTYKSAPAKVFAAFGDAALRKKLFGVTQGAVYELDFSVGGREYNVGAGPNGAEFVYDAQFRDLVPDQRVVYSYEMLMDGKRISVSVAAIELMAEGQGTRLKLTETGVYLDGLDTSAQREEGTNYLFTMLGDLIDQA